MKEYTHGFLYGLNMWVEGEKGWFVGEHMQALFEWDYNTHMCKLIGALPDYEEIRFSGNSRCVKYNEYIYCLPHLGTCIWVYDLSSKIFDKIEIDNTVGVNIDMNYVGQKDGYIFCFSHNFKKMFKIDGEKKKLEMFSLLEDETAEYANFLMIENCIMTWCKNKSAICSFDIVSGEVEMEYIPELKDKGLAFCFDGEKYWFVGKSTELYIWDPHEQNCECINEFSEDLKICYDGKELPFGGPICKNGVIWIPQWRANRSICIAKEDREINEMVLGDWRLDTGNEGLPMSYQYSIKERYMGFYSWREHKIIEVDLEQRTWQYKEIIDGPAIGEFLRKNPKWYKHYLGESELHRMFYGEMMLDASTREVDVDHQSIGTRIYNTL